jgi:predicted MFS family arabinose efflux permease
VLLPKFYWTDPFHFVEHQGCCKDLPVTESRRTIFTKPDPSLVTPGMHAGTATSAELTVDQRTPWGQHALLYVVFFLMGAEMFLVSPLLPQIARSLGATIAAAATIVTAYVVVYALMSPLLGIFADRWPRKRSAIAGSVVFLIGNIGCAITPDLGGLIAARGVTGLGAALAAPAIWAYLAERTAAHQRGRAISLGLSFSALGQILGVPLGATLAAVGGWRASFLAVSVLMLVATITLAGRAESTPVAAAPRGLTALIRPWSSPEIRLGLLATFLLQAGRLGAYTYVGAIFAVRFGLNVSALGLVGLLVGAGSMVGSLVAGTILDQLARRGVPGTWVSALAALLFIPCAVVATTTGHLWVALTALGLWFMFGGAFLSSQQTFLSSADPSQRATVVAWNNSMMNAGTAVGTTALGFVVAGSATFAAVAGALGLAAAAAAALPLIAKARASSTVPGGYLRLTSWLALASRAAAADTMSDPKAHRFAEDLDRDFYGYLFWWRGRARYSTVSLRRRVQRLPAK